MKIDLGRWQEANQMEEVIQKAAWRLVRSAVDRMGDGRGSEKLLFCIEKLGKEFPTIGSRSEDFIRAAYIQYKLETKSVS